MIATTTNNSIRVKAAFRFDSGRWSLILTCRSEFRQRHRADSTPRQGYSSSTLCGVCAKSA